MPRTAPGTALRADGVAVEAPGLRIESLGEVAWRIRPDRAGKHLLTVRAGGETVQKDLIVGSGYYPK